MVPVSRITRIIDLQSSYRHWLALETRAGLSLQALPTHDAFQSDQHHTPSVSFCQDDFDDIWDYVSVVSSAGGGGGGGGGKRTPGAGSSGGVLNTIRGVRLDPTVPLL
jgi:hypothetical protein